MPRTPLLEIYNNNLQKKLHALIEHCCSTPQQWEYTEWLSNANRTVVPQYIHSVWYYIATEVEATETTTVTHGISKAHFMLLTVEMTKGF